MSVRSARGFSSTEDAPPFDAAAAAAARSPIDDVTDLTFGSARMIVATCQLVRDHRLEADALRHLGLAVELPDVLARDEAHRDDPEAVDRRDERAGPTPAS